MLLVHKLRWNLVARYFISTFSPTEEFNRDEQFSSCCTPRPGILLERSKDREDRSLKSILSWISCCFVNILKRSVVYIYSFVRIIISLAFFCFIIMQ